MGATARKRPAQDRDAAADPACTKIVDEALDAIRMLDLATSRYRATLASDWGITVTDSLVMSNLATVGGQMTPRDLGKRLMLSSGTLTTMVDRLEAGGYVSRVANPKDRRSLLVRLTDKGRKSLFYSREMLGSALDDAVPRAAIGQFAKGLRALAAAMDSITTTMIDARK